MTIYEGLTLGFVAFGILFIILGFTFNRTKRQKNDDDATMEDETFRKQINLVNEKVLELGEYHNFVKDEIEKKHKELLFLYQMVSEKEKSIKQIQVEIEILQKSPVSIKEETIHETVENAINSNKRIIDLREQGYSSKEIAQILGIGTGEVNLVLNLYE